MVNPIACDWPAKSDQCHNARGKEVPNITMNALVDAVKATGTIGVIGVFVPQDPHAQIN